MTFSSANHVAKSMNSSHKKPHSTNYASKNRKSHEKTAYIRSSHEISYGSQNMKSHTEISQQPKSMTSQKQRMYVATKQEHGCHRKQKISTGKSHRKKRCCTSQLKFYKEILRDNYAANNNRIERGNLVEGSTRMTSHKTIFQLPSTKWNRITKSISWGCLTRKVCSKNSIKSH
jgi:hypothetical protein